MMSRLFKFIGGTHVPGYKDISTQTSVAPAKLPSKLILPLHQHIGAPAEPIVKIGQYVRKGEKIAKASDFVSAPVHAPTSGHVINIGDEAVPHPSGMRAECIVIEPDGEDRWTELTGHATDYREMDPSELRQLIRNAGIVGLGGAGFPSFIKLNPGPERRVETLILNGAECEPYITCDDMLMRERANEIIIGLLIIRHALKAQQCIIAIEDNKTEAIAAMRSALSEFHSEGVNIQEIPTIYPAGGEKQLIHTVTGKEVPSDGLPIHVGVVCQNVATAAAIYRAVNHGEPVISRYLTITGDVGKPCNLEVLFGTPMNELIEQCGGLTGKLRRIIMGGPMMGFALHSDDLPVMKTTNCIVADCGNSAHLSERKYVMPCIRCGECATVCPVKLMPQQLYWHARAHEFDRTQDYHLFDCIECGCCDYVCPSQIPLVQYYRFAKAEIWASERDKAKSDIARERHEFRQERLEREKREREERLRQKKAALKKPAAEQGTAESSEKTPATDPKKAAILAAMERVKAKKNQQEVQPKNVDNLSEDQRKLIDEIDARRAKQRTEPSDSEDVKE